MKHITEIVRYTVRLKVHWDTVRNNIVSDIIRDNVWNNVRNTIWVNVGNNVGNNVLYNYKLFHYNYLQQYKDNL
jgi:hypothetical protein